MSENARLVQSQITELVEPVLQEMDFELVDVEYLHNHGKWTVRLYIDKQGGVTIGDCALVSREIGDLIDVKDIVNHEYVLEVSSPGLDRPLKKEKDFRWAIGKKIKVRLFDPLEGRKNYTGYLRGFENGTINMDIDGRTMDLPLSRVKKANLVYQF